jgi:hypothetical protein
MCGRIEDEEGRLLEVTREAEVVVAASNPVASAML